MRWRQVLDLADDRTKEQRKVMDDEYAYLGVKDPKATERALQSWPEAAKLEALEIGGGLGDHITRPIFAPEPVPQGAPNVAPRLV